ncbi:RagB/SusD family nutrient uptake outer membrane protein [Arenibacter sp. 6A1]|uniref:RagB/SusD family nutrient uptake outer membrane protein n=1 Tax=Arenibacter sp. 6A1 TaxID=2720391 RepID=UPI0014468088|nr:RagB/SusD family nutrient uptake outer membrane protein [Arenibacter sp. 6A1]NKI25267.1 RagB/SusD family nutrient uptake outer membrane protein [Arenibacter sp. 6A1]
MKIINYSILLLLLFFATSCSDVLEKSPLNEISDDAFWNDPVLVSYYINDLYANLPLQQYQLGESRTDNSVHSQRDKWRASSFLYNYNLENADNPSEVTWRTSYENIRKFNRFLEKIELSSLSLEEINSYKGEVYFLRAFTYFELVKRYGGVVLLNEVLSLKDNWEIPRSTEDETYDFIFQDLKKACELLPDYWEGKDKGRATKGAAWALRSRAALYNNRYDQAIEAAEEVYKFGYNLVPGQTPEQYRSIWWTTNKDNSEIIFDKQFSNPDVSNAMLIYHMVTYINDPYGDRGWGGLGPTQNLIDQYELKDGSQAPQFSGKPETEIFDIHESGIYENREPRFYASIVFHGANIWLNGDKGPVAVDRYTMDTPDKGDGSMTGYNVWKWIDYDNYNYPYAGSSSKDHSINWIYFRLAEVILNEAEARVEKGDITGALTAVNKIRSRVGLPNLTETNQLKLRELIRKERRIELAFEDHRFWDIRRWRIGNKTNQGVMSGVRFISPTKFYISNTDTRTWDDRLYYHPIPRSEIVRMNVLEQNPGF